MKILTIILLALICITSSIEHTAKDIELKFDLIEFNIVFLLALIGIQIVGGFE